MEQVRTNLPDRAWNERDTKLDNLKKDLYTASKMHVSINNNGSVPLKALVL